MPLLAFLISFFHYNSVDFDFDFSGTKIVCLLLVKRNDMPAERYIEEKYWAFHLTRAGERAKSSNQSAESRKAANNVTETFANFAVTKRQTC